MDHECFVIADADGVIRAWSGGAEAAFGHRAAAAVGQTLDMIVPEAFRQDHWAGFRRAVAAGTAAAEDDPGPFPVLCADGTVAETPGRLQLLRHPGGRVIAAMVVFEVAAAA